MSSKGYRDYFSVLGVSRNAGPKEIKQAFRTLARKYHPDVNSGDQTAEEKFKEVNEAYEVLSDPDKRRRYEQFGQYWSQTGSMPGYSSVDRSGFDIDFGKYGNFDEFINELLGRYGASQATDSFGGRFTRSQGFNSSYSKNSFNLDAEVNLKIKFDEAFRGSERMLSVNGQRVKVRIPKGVLTGSKLRLKGKGNLQSGTGQRGDLYLKIDVQPHSIWRVDGKHIYADLPVSYEELVLGSSVRLVIPDGQAELVIPQGTSLSRVFRLKGKGWPASDGRGDLFFSLSLEIPSDCGEEELEHLRQILSRRELDPRDKWAASASL